MITIRFATLRWTSALICAGVGALMALAPHQFEQPIYALFHSQTPLWAGAFLATGVAQFASLAFTPSRGFTAVSQLITAGVLGALATTCLLNNDPIHGTLALSLAIGNLAALWVVLAPPGHSTSRRDVLSAVLAASLLVVGGGLLQLWYGLPDQLTLQLEATPPAVGAVLATAGTVLALTFLFPSFLGLVGRVATSAIGGALLAITIRTLGLTGLYWPAAITFTSVSLGVALAPWLGTALGRVDPAALRSRLVFLLTVSITLPMTFMISYSSQQQEDLTRARGILEDQLVADVTAANIDEVVRQSQAAIAELAGRPGLATLSADEQQGVLRLVVSSAAVLDGIAIVDDKGRRKTTVGFTGQAELAAQLASAEPPLATATDVVVTADATGTEVFLVAPLMAADQTVPGRLVAKLATSQLAARIADPARMEERRLIALVDDRYRVIVGGSEDERALASRRAMEAQARTAEKVSVKRLVAGPDDGSVAVLARIGRLGWFIVVERPLAAVLAPMRLGRDLAFLLVGVTALGAVTVGLFTATWLARPLQTLATAVGRLATGDSRAPLPATTLAEIGQLSRGFAALRDHLVVEAAERGQAEAGLRFLAEASRQLGGTLDYPETLSSVVRLATPALADHCQIEFYDANGAVFRTVTADAIGGEAVIVYDSDADGEAGPQSQTDWESEEAGRPPLTIPLVARGQTFGSMTLSWRGGTGTALADLSLAGEYVRRAAVAIDHAGLYRRSLAEVRVREEFISIASHELRTPLTTIKGYVQLLGRRLRRLAPEDAQATAMFEQLETQVGRLEELVNDLLDISRLQGGHLALRREQTDLVAIVRDVARRADQMPEYSAFHQIEVELPSTCEGCWDTARLDQVITNLLTNALKYSPQGGMVKITVSGNAQEATLSISDQGIGIAPAEQAIIFQPFGRGEAARARFAGSGLGLYIGAQIVARHGGSLSVTSTPGVGSTFTMRLPRTLPVEALGSHA